MVSLNPKSCEEKAADTSDPFFELSRLSFLGADQNYLSAVIGARLGGKTEFHGYAPSQILQIDVQGPKEPRTKVAEVNLAAITLPRNYRPTFLGMEVQLMPDVVGALSKLQTPDGDLIISGKGSTDDVFISEYCRK